MYEAHPPRLINVATLSCEVETPKMHMSTISPFNANYKIAVKCIK